MEIRTKKISRRAEALAERREQGANALLGFAKKFKR